MSIAHSMQAFFDYSLSAALIGIPLILYSIYYQWQVEKKWCAICLFIICVFIAQLIIFAFSGSINFTGIEAASFTTFISGFIISALGWFLVKPKIKSYFDLRSSELAATRFKRNYSLFKLALRDSQRYDYTALASDIYIGEADAPLKISLVTNLFCGYCVKMHDQLEEILSRYGNQIRLNIRFNFEQRDGNVKSDAIHYRLIEIYHQQGQKAFMDAFGAWFRDKDKDSWLAKFGSAEANETSTAMFKLQYEQNTSNALTFTPALIIGEHLFAKVYDRADLIYFISELIQDEELIFTFEDLATIAPLKFPHYKQADI